MSPTSPTTESGRAPALPILHVFSTFMPAGPQTRTVALINAFGEHFRHTIVAMDGREEAAEIIEPGIDFQLRPAPERAGFFGTLRQLRKLIETERPRLICTYNWGAIETVMASASLGGRPLIHHEEGFGPEEAAAFKRRRVWMRRFLFRRLPALVVPSHNLAQIARDLWKVEPERLHVLANGVDLERFALGERPAAAAAELRRELGIPQDSLVVGSVGHLRREKNYARLITAVGRARKLAPEHDCRLLLVGDGPERALLEAKARELGLEASVHFAGHRADCAPALFAMDIFSLSSDTEQMPISLIEAMAAERPVVATDVGDVARMLPEEGRALAIGLDEGAEGLARGLVELAGDPERRRALARAGRERAQALYGFESMRSAYFGLYLETMGEKPVDA